MSRTLLGPFRVVWLGSNTVVYEECRVYNDWDDAMPAYGFQHTLAPLLRFQNFDEVRAFAGPSDRYELTPKPLLWKLHFGVPAAHRCKEVKDAFSRIRRAWRFLIDNNLPIVVTRHAASDIKAARDWCKVVRDT